MIEPRTSDMGDLIAAELAAVATPSFTRMTMGETASEQIARRHREEELAVALLRERGWIVQRPGLGDFFTRSKRKGSLREAPYSIDQTFQVKVGDQWAELTRRYTWHSLGIPVHVLASEIAGMVGRLVIDRIAPSIAKELQWIEQEPRT